MNVTCKTNATNNTATLANSESQDLACIINNANTTQGNIDATAIKATIGSQATQNAAAIQTQSGYSGGTVVIVCLVAAALVGVVTWYFLEKNEGKI